MRRFPVSKLKKGINQSEKQEKNLCRMEFSFL